MKQSEFYDAQMGTLNTMAREYSTTIFLKKFNNFIKTVLINHYTRELSKYGLSILDLCCGRGGDIGKWAKQNIFHYVGADLSEPLVKEARSRYLDTFVDNQ